MIFFENYQNQVSTVHINATKTEANTSTAFVLPVFSSANNTKMLISTTKAPNLDLSTVRQPLISKNTSTASLPPVFTTVNNAKVLDSNTKTPNLDKPFVRQPFLSKKPVHLLFNEQEKNHSVEQPFKKKRLIQETTSSHENNFNADPIFLTKIQL